jgi:hypothetical protein
MYLEEQAKSLVRLWDEKKVVTEINYHLKELNRVFFDAKIFLNVSPSQEQMPPAYVHARAIALYIDSFNKIRKDSSDADKLIFPDYDKLVASVAEKMDLRVNFTLNEILTAQEYYGGIFKKVNECMNKR